MAARELEARWIGVAIPRVFFTSAPGAHTMPRAMWTGSIAFGLVSIPVELHPAEDRRSFSFTMLDKRDLAPVGYKRFNKKSGREVPWGDVVKGYEYESDRYVVLTDEDFKKANVKATQTIDIRSFVPEGSIPPWYFDAPYYLTPGKRGAKPYALLRETLKDSGRVAVAQVVIRTTQHLAAIVVDGAALVLNTMRYDDEFRSMKGLTIPPAGLKSAGITTKEVDLARRLVDDLAADWGPQKYVDSYHKDLMARIRQKIKKGDTEKIAEPKEAKEKEGGTKVLDLTALLQRSLEKDGKKRAVRASPARAHRKRA
jgi:DNA end-binding protein Ku